MLHDVVQSEVFCLDFLRDKADVGLCLKSALKGDVRCRTAHELDEMPVFACRVAVALDVADNLAVGLASGVEAERSLDLVVLQVAVDGLGTADYLHAVVLCSVVFGQNACVGVGVVAADDYESLDVELAQNLDALFKLLFLLEFGAAAADEVEATSVAVVFEQLFGNLDVFVVNETAGAHEKTVEAVFGVELLHFVKQTRDYVVSARSLAAAEDYAHVDGLLCGLLCGNKLHEGHSVCVGEKFFDFLLIVNALCGSAFLYLHCTLECFRQFRLIGRSLFLQCAKFHIDF